MNEDAVDLSGHFKALLEYTVYHFTSEESLMEKCQYPDLAEHVQQHRAFTEKVAEYQKQANLYGPNLMIRKMLDYLTAWLTSHILILDNKYEQYILDFD